MNNPLKSVLQSLRVRRLMLVRSAIAIVSGASLLSILVPAQAAEKLVFTYGLFGRSITTAELEDFAETGKQTPTLKFLLKATKQNPEQVRASLSQEVKVSPKLLDQLLYTLPGEYALFMTGQIFHTPARQSNDKALRSALILSTVDDRQLSMLEFLQNYPTQEFYVDGYQLAKTAKDVTKLVNRVETKFEGPIAIITDLFNGVICECERPPGPDSPINAN